MCINKTLSNAAANFLAFIVSVTSVKRGSMMRHFRKQLISSDNGSDIFRTFPVILFFCAILPALCLSPGTAAGAMDLADEPMMAQIKAAPANIMIVLDDSGSMTYEVLTAGYYDGRFPNPNQGTEDGYCYIYDYLGDNAYTDSLRYMGSEGRKYWKSQFYGVNAMYYNPGSTYEPWPDYPGQTFSPADMETPKPHPLKTGTTTLDLDADSFTVAREGGPNLAVKHAHYFVKDSSNDVWLVVIDGESSPKAIKYYKVTDIDGTGLAEKVVKVREEPPPSEIVTGRTYLEERQNFANWFTYARRREYVAKSAIARVINHLQGVRVGILGINGKIIVPLKPLGVWKSGIYYDKRDELLDELFDYDSNGGTPLREGLNAVGKYYKDNSLNLGGQAGDERPYYSEADGGACQQSFTIVMTDGYYSTVGNDLGADNADGDNNTAWDGGFYADNLSETLADVAMYYYETDLRSDLPNRLNDPNRLNPSAIDTAQHQHMVTFGVAFGVSGNLNPENYNDDPTSADFLKDGSGNYPSWPTSISIRSKETIDDLYHATVNGRGDFLTAKDPEELADSLLALMNSILDRLGSAAAVSINGDTLYSKVSEDVLMFQASYKTNDWSGDVKAYGVDIFTGRVLVENPKWSAADSLSATDRDDRNILTYNGYEGVEFDPAEPAIDWNAILGSDFANIISYVRGKNDIPGFRVRNKLLGDIVHSSPVFKHHILSAGAEKDFIYVGANDGMLHAFQITSISGTVSGQEKFAYVPSFVHQNLVNLTETPMDHKYFVDLSPTVVTGFELLGGEDEDETILVGGLGKGGKGYFALDITDPTTMGTDQVLWEFPNGATSGEAPDMGYSFSKPLVVQTNSTIASEAWVVIAGNGYDSANGRAVLYLLQPATGAVTKKFPATVSDTDNGLSSPIAVDVNFDRKVDFVYAGDLKGNMWKFDLTGDQASKWSVAYHDGTNNQPLFQAKGPTGLPQPITTKPEVMFHPQEYQLRKHGLMVLFGTGKFLGKSDFDDDSVQTVYGIWDYGDRALFPGPWGLYSNDDDKEFLGAFNRPDLSNHTDKNVTLLEQTATTYSVSVTQASGQTVAFNIRVLSGDEPNWFTEPDEDTAPALPDLSDSEDGSIAGHGGWYWDLPLDGERVISDVLLRDGRLIVIPFTPDSDRCSDGGSSFLMELNSFTGGTSGGAIFDINNDGKIDSGDLVNIHMDGDGGYLQVFPDGLQMAGNVQPPAILILDNKIELKYLSSSTGAVHMVGEKAVRLGVTYWKELDR
jgi:type IV pilus assembly protein PilY1